MYTSQFDDLFRAAATKYLQPWQGHAWCWLKAEAIAESNLDPNVTASDGGMGIAQFMMPTWIEQCVELGWTESDGANPPPYDPNYAIPAMAHYLRSWWDEWSAPRPAFDRLQLTQASYNCGFGNMLKAQRLANGANDYDTIIAQLPNVTGYANARITANYIRRIHDIYVELTTV
ncbi:MAG TPA: transglycosylase SLT domain-containing protein [Terracidiphilus sp.]|jgi:membrane-bound lytic murein transglycosylase F|nr:transglycosylase SLT domain-containing protein [Terracidiphilus sp.]